MNRIMPNPDMKYRKAEDFIVRILLSIKKPIIGEKRKVNSKENDKTRAAEFSSTYLSVKVKKIPEANVSLRILKNVVIRNTISIW